MNKCLVTGGCGFIGGSLLAELAKADVEILVSDQPGRRIRSDLPKDKIVLFADGLSNLHLHTDELSGIDAVFHLAACTDPLKPDECRASQVEGTRALLRVLSSIKGAKPIRVIHFNTARIYGKQEGPYNEKTPPRPAGAYATAKWNAWKIIRDSGPGIHPVDLRFFTIFGPGQPPRMFLSQLIGAIRNGEDFSMSAGAQTLDWMYVSDAARAALLLANMPEEKFARNEFIVSAGAPVRVLDAAKLALEMTGNSIRLKVGALPIREGEVMRYYAEADAFYKATGFTALTAFREGLRLTLQAAGLLQPKDR